MRSCLFFIFVLLGLFVVPDSAFASEGGFLWLSHLGIDHHFNHVVTAMFVGASVVLLTFVAGQQVLRVMARSDGGIVPEGKLTFRNAFEAVGEALYSMTVMVLGEHDAPRYFAVVGSLFLFIFFSNLVGLIPGMLPPTENLNTTLALGFFVFVYYNWQGIKEHKAGYIKHFMGPMLAMAPLILVIEIISHLVRPLSLALRLRGNIMGDHIVLSVFNELGVPLVPTIFYGLGLFVSFMQSYVFVLLTMVYISLANSHDH